MANCGFSMAEAKSIEENYHAMYVVSDEWVASKINQASKDGYITLAFGLRLRTPILGLSVMDSRYTPQQAAAEARTAGNAVSGQSYGLLNSRAMVEVMDKVHASEYRYDIKPSNVIHDAGYFMVRNDPKVLAWFNENVVKAYEWQDLPEIQHDEVKLSGNLGLFYPSWANEIELPHNISVEELEKLLNDYND